MPESRGEFARLRALLAQLPVGERVVVGPGDDAAVVRLLDGAALAITTDAVVEGRHFRPDLLAADAIGRRLAAANLSDLAAMGAHPRWAVLALAVPASWSATDVEALERSCAATLHADGAAIVGGNLVATDGALVATLTLCGELEGAPWTRGGARAGDVLAVTGAPGRAAATLGLALWEAPYSLERAPRDLRDAYTSPPSRVRFALALRDAGVVRAAIDVSDGLAADLSHLLEASGVGAVVERLPRDQALWRAARDLVSRAGAERGALLPPSEPGAVEYLALGPSDDYELLLALDPSGFEAAQEIARAHGVPLTAIARLDDVRGRLAMQRADGTLDPVEPRGYDHFE